MPENGVSATIQNTNRSGLAHLNEIGKQQIHEICCVSLAGRHGMAVVCLQWQRDSGGLVTNLTYAAGKSVSQAHDANGRLVSVKDWLGHEWTFTRDALGRVTAMTSPDGLSDTFTYDAAGRLTGRACLSGTAAELWGRAIAYDSAGQRVRDSITAVPMPAPASPRHAVNTFDAADRLVSASVRYGTDAPVAETFAYDLNGAMTNWTGGAGGDASLSLAYNALGQMSQLITSYTANYGPHGLRMGFPIWFVARVSVMPLTR